MNQAERNFLEGLLKESELSPESIQALGIQSPDELDALEEQAASGQPQEGQEQPQEQPDEKAIRQRPRPVDVPPDLFRGDDVHPLRLLVFLREQYGDAWVEWLPETLWTTIRNDVGSISDVNKNKVQALSLALMTDVPWNDWQAFENVGCSFNGTIPVFGQMQPLSPAETAFTIQTLKKLHDFNFSDDVRGYIASVCMNRGIVYAPKKWFSNVQDLIDEQNKSPELFAQFKQAWTKLNREDLSNISLSDDKVMDVQMAKLWAIKEYLREQALRLRGKRP